MPVPDRSAPAADRPAVACYCATFLKPEMLHIYRQITSLTRVRPFVIAQKREEAERYPFDAVTVVGKPATHFLRRIWFKQIRDTPWQISGVEGDARIRVLRYAGGRRRHGELRVAQGHGWSLHRAAYTGQRVVT